ncbi:hypothetical protein [Nonomuraea sp. NPDC049784]|uniref:hypothetical protein n=1 Tax=Nonomuraea sp. NPDC049784 TaxID=3154361 RepID=UPI0033C6F317
MAELEPGATLDDVLALITEQIIATTAFIDMVDANTAGPRALAMRDRVGNVPAGKLAEAQRAGPALRISTARICFWRSACLSAFSPRGPRRRGESQPPLMGPQPSWAVWTLASRPSSA